MAESGRLNRLGIIQNAFESVLGDINNEPDGDDFATGFQLFREGRRVSNRGRRLTPRKVKPTVFNVVILPKYSASYTEQLKVKESSSFDKDVFFKPHKVRINSGEDMVQRLHQICTPLSSVDFQYYKLDKKKIFHLIGAQNSTVQQLKDEPVCKRSKLYIMPEEGVDLSEQSSQGPIVARLFEEHGELLQYPQRQH